MSRKGSKKSKSRVSELSDTHHHGTKTRGSKLATPKVSGTKADAAMSVTQTTHAQVAALLLLSCNLDRLRRLNEISRRMRIRGIKSLSSIATNVRASLARW